jgi:hypothetical protein
MTGYRRLSVMRASGVDRTECVEQPVFDRRIPDKDALVREVTAWMHDRNVHQSTKDYFFMNARRRRR